MCCCPPSEIPHDTLHLFVMSDGNFKILKGVRRGIWNLTTFLSPTSLPFFLPASLTPSPPPLTFASLSFPSLCSRHNPNEGGRTAISANWVEDTQAQLGAMMATVPHCHRQPFFIEQSEAILAGPRDATHLPTWRYF